MAESNLKKKLISLEILYWRQRELWIIFLLFRKSLLGSDLESFIKRFLLAALRLPFVKWLYGTVQWKLTHWTFIFVNAVLNQFNKHSTSCILLIFNCFVKKILRYWLKKWRIIFLSLSCVLTIFWYQWCVERYRTIFEFGKGSSFTRFFCLSQELRDMVSEVKIWVQIFLKIILQPLGTLPEKM